MNRILSARLKDLLATKGISIATFAEMCDLPLETVRNIYYGRTEDPKVSTLLKISQALDMSVNCLLGECPHSQDERMLLQHYRLCGEHGKSVIRLVAKYEALAVKEERESTTTHKIPCLVSRTNIHDGIVYDECEVVEIDTAVKDAFVAIKVTTNDLVPVYCKGDVILIANRFPKNGEYAVFYNGPKAYIRKFIEEDNQYRLHCVHNLSEDVVLKRMDQVEYVGTCVGVVRS